eukprot:CAMPEP_0116551656 /NCGR_PEP_ID=MMETSP0397-20121206/6073_1 /TAXON_ID=216820 /ORGANISM="Cyclophora tenuis, Strain ECT3854" /LENGTH=384 /DNA_ID=CAMNT_0004076561 /DNA_START=15 /DNA_END=1170 /DNA_ORIENTATION=-
MGLTLLVVTTSPGGSYSNWFCALFNAELALSVAMTAASTILAIGFLPGNLFFVGALDFGALFITLGVVISGILGGLYSSYKIDSKLFRIWANRLANVSGVMLIVVSFFLSAGGGGGNTTLWGHPWTLYVGVAFPCVLGIFIATFLAKSLGLTSPECMTIGIECCYQNPGIATSVAITMFDDPDERAAAVSIPLLYGGLQALVIGIYCILGWKLGWSKAPASDGFCTIVSTNYEIESIGQVGSEEEDETDEEGARRLDGDEVESHPQSRPRTSTEELECIEEEDNEDDDSGGGLWGWIFGGRRQRPRPQQRQSTPAKRLLENQDFAEDDTPKRVSTPYKREGSRDRVMSEDTQATTVASSLPSTPTGTDVRGQEIRKFPDLEGMQ